MRSSNTFEYWFLVLGCLAFMVVVQCHAQALQYTYDPMQRLTRVQYGDGTTIEYVYDNLGNRLMKRTSLAGTPANHSPNPVNNPFPTNNSTGVSTTPTLRWSPGGDPDAGDAVVGFVYLGESAIAPLAWSGWSTNFTSTRLQPLTKYYWYVVSRDSCNAQTTSVVWQFTTTTYPPVANFRADQTNGWAPFTVRFTDTSTDDIAVVSWKWDFNNDGQVDATNRNPTCIYSNGGDYTVSLTVADEHGGTNTLIRTNFISVLAGSILDFTSTALTVQSAGSSRNLALVYSIANLGTNSVTAKWQWYDCFYISSNTVLDGEDAQIACFYEYRSVSAGELYTRTNSASIPSGISTGIWYLILEPDGYEQIPEISETNNTRVFALTTLPDLVALSLEWRGEPVAGEPLQVVYSVINQGALPMDGAWYDSIYLSSNSTWDADDRRVGDFYKDQTLMPGEAYSYTGTVNMTTWAPGTYYLFLRTDSYDGVVESNEANNTMQTTLPLSQPDLVPVSLTAPTSAVPGQSVQAIWTVTNRGTGTAMPQWYDELYYSADTVWDAQDVSLSGLWRYNALGVGSTYASTSSVQIPKDVTSWISVIPGTCLSPATNALAGSITWEYWFGIAGSNVLNLTNSVNFPDNPSGSDLLASFETSENIGYEYGSRVSGYLRPTTSGVYRFWIASDDQSELWLSTNDNPNNKTRIAQVPGQTGVRQWTKYTEQRSPLVSLIAGKNYYIEALHKEDSGDDHLAVGWRQEKNTYYLITKVDDYGYVSEMDESNNTSQARAIVLYNPDLAPTGIQAPSIGVAGELIDIIYGVTNRGSGTALASWYDELYLSDDQILDDQDYSLGSVYQNRSLTNGFAYSRTNTVTLPQWPGGTYYVFFKTDINNYLYESDETNNTTGPRPIVLTVPDLAPVSLQVPALGQSGRQIQVVYMVTNQGNGVAYASWYDQLFLSSNALLDAQDYTLASWYQNSSLTNGCAYSRTNTISLPQWPIGVYYLILKVDGYNYVFEPNEINNKLAPVTITLGLPDLAPIHLYIMENALVGSPVRVVYTVTNRGNEIAYASWYDHLYLSSNAILDSQDYSLGSWYQNQSITNGFAYTRTNTVSFPQWPDGTYYFILHVDNWDYIFESSEDNNTSVCAVTVSPPLLKNASFELEGSVVSNAAYWESGVPDEHGMRWGSASRVSWRSYDESWEGCIPGTWAGMGTNGGFWQEVPAVAGARYVVSGWFWADQGTYSGSPWTSATKGLKLEFLKGGSPLSGITNSLSGVGETWEEFIVDGAAPVSANWVRVSVFANGVSTNGALQFDNFRLSRFPFDSDEDGLIDEWEFTYYPSLTNTSGNADPDRDGATCWEEWMAGTDPTNNKSFLGMRMPQPSSGSGVYVRWASVTGKVYAVDRSTNLNSTPAFLTLQQQIYGQPGTTVYFDTTSPGLSPRFYRVRIEP